VKTVNVTEARERLAEIFGSAQREPVCIIRHGKPLVVVAGVEGQDLAQVFERHGQPARARKRK
jgi:prevent-host-death family protein